MTSGALQQDQTDLAEFAAHGSRDAFERLARRHADFVYGVARRETARRETGAARDAHLADDITQAVFLILARRAGSIRAAAITSWLFTTTRNVAANARKMEARRKFHEHRAAEMRSENAMGTKTDTSVEFGRDLLDALAAQRETDRTIVLMRYVQGLEFNDIAAVIGLSEVATRKRLERGLVKLREFLIGRGVTTETATLCVAIGQMTSPAPTALVTAAATSSAATPAIELAAATMKSLLAGSIKLAASILIGVGMTAVIGTMALKDLKSTSSSPPAVVAVARPVSTTTNESAPPASMPAIPADTVAYTGVVTDPAGKPVAGVRVWCELLATTSTKPSPNEAETTTDSGGRYLLADLRALTPEANDNWLRRLIHFEHPDHAIAWKTIREESPDADAAAREISVQFDAAAQVPVKVVDAAGNAVSGAEVTILLQHVIRDPKVPRASGFGMTRTFTASTKRTTDAQGRATFDRIPATARVAVFVTHPAFREFASWDASRTRAYEITPGDVEPYRVTLSPGASLRVHVAMGPGKPVPATGVINFDLPENEPNRAGNFGSADAAPDQTFLFTGLEPGRHDLLFRSGNHETQSGIWIPRRGVELKAGETTDVTFTNVDGHPLTGRLVDAKTKRPVAEAYVSASVRTTPNDESSNVYLQGTRSDAEGRFTLNVLPGDVLIKTELFVANASQWTERHITVAADTARPADAPIDMGDFEIKGPTIVRGRLVDPEGKPIAIGFVRVDRQSEPTRPDGTFAMTVGMYDDPATARAVFAFNRDGSLGKAVLLDDTMLDPTPALNADVTTIALEKTCTITGRLVDEHGKAVSGAEIDLNFPMPGKEGFFWHYTPPALGAIVREGDRFTFPRVPTGLALNLNVRGMGTGTMFVLGDLLPGEKHDVGDLLLAPEQHDKAPAFAATLSGVLLDENERPVAGVRVDASPIKHRLPQPWQDVTDRRGAFHFQSLPVGEPILLYATPEGFADVRDTVEAAEGQKITLRTSRASIIGKPAPEIVADTWCNGEKRTLAAQRGKVVVLLVGVLIPPFDGVNAFQQVDDAVKKCNDKGLVTIAIARPFVDRVNRASTADGVAEYVKTHAVPYPIAIDAADDDPRQFDGQTKSIYGIKTEGAAIVVIDKKGNVRAVPRRDELAEWIERLLAE